MTRFIVMTRAARMPGSCWGRYGRVAVVETDLPADREPAMISTRSIGVVRIVETWERRHIGGTEKSAFHQAVAEARGLANMLNAKRRKPARRHVRRAHVRSGRLVPEQTVNQLRSVT